MSSETLSNIDNNIVIHYMLFANFSIKKQLKTRRLDLFHLLAGIPLSFVVAGVIRGTAHPRGNKDEVWIAAGLLISCLLIFRYFLQPKGGKETEKEKSDF